LMRVARLQMRCGTCRRRPLAPLSSSSLSREEKRRMTKAGVKKVSRESGGRKTALLCRAEAEDETLVTTEAEAPNGGRELEEEEAAGDGGGGLLGGSGRSGLPDVLAATTLVLPFFFWGTSMVAMKFEAVHTTPLFLGSFRLIPAGLALLVWSKYFAGTERREIDVVPKALEDWGKILVWAFVDATCFQGFLAEGLQRTGAGIGSIIIDSQPISVAIMAALFLDEKITTKTALGLAVGVLGLVILEVGPQDAGVVVDSQGNGQLLMLLAAQSMAVGTILVRWVCKTIDPVVATGWHMVLGGLPLLFVSLSTDTDLMQRLEGLGPADVLLLSYITLLGGAASYGLFFVNASKGNLTKLSSLTFLTPVFACFFGNVLLNESFNTLQILGAATTLLGIFLV